MSSISLNFEHVRGSHLLKACSLDLNLEGHQLLELNKIFGGTESTSLGARGVDMCYAQHVLLVSIVRVM